MKKKKILIAVVCVIAALAAICLILSLIHI